DHPGRRTCRRPRPAGLAALLRRTRAGGPGDADRAPVPAATGAAGVLAAAVGRDAAGARRAQRPLDPGVPGLHLLPGRLPHHADPARAGPGAVGNPARPDPTAGAVRV